MKTKPIQAEKPSEVKKPKSTVEWLLQQIDDYRAKNPSMSEATFGWNAIGSTGLVPRLRAGGDVTTRKFDAIVRYMGKSKQKGSINGDESKKQIEDEA